MPNGDIEVDNQTWLWFFFFSNYYVNGSARCPTNDGKCWVTFNWWGNPPDVNAKKANYNILSTDYDNYTIIYGCSNTWYGGKQESAWIMTREKTASPSAVKAYETMLNQLMPIYNQESMDVSE